MFNETFASFQPASWQQQGLVTVPPDEWHKPASRIVRKMEKWIVTTSAAIALSAAFAGSFPAQTSVWTGNAGETKRLIIGFEKGVVASKVQGAEVSANYWSEMAQEVVKWPRLSVSGDFEEGPEPIL